MMKTRERERRKRKKIVLICLISSFILKNFKMRISLKWFYCIYWNYFLINIKWFEIKKREREKQIMSYFKKKSVYLYNILEKGLFFFFFFKLFKSLYGNLICFCFFFLVIVLILCQKKKIIILQDYMQFCKKKIV